MSIKGSLIYIFIGIIISILIRNSGYYFLAIGLVLIFILLIKKFDVKVAVIFIVSSSLFYIYKPNTNDLNLKEEYIESNYTISEAKENYLIVKDSKGSYLVYFSSIKEELDLHTNEVISIKGDLKEIESSLDIDVFDFSKYLYNKRVYYQINAYEIKSIKYEEQLNDKVVNLITSKLEDDSYNMVKMLLFNDKYVDYESYSNLKSINALHLFVVSGFHISFFFSLIVFLFKKASSEVGELVALCVCLFYVYLLKFPISATRAVLSLALYKFFKDYLNRLDCVAIPGILFLAIEPLNIYNYSFILTFIMTITITFAGDFLNDVNKLAKPFILSLICFLAMIPIQLIMNYEINFISLLSNIVLSYVVMVIFVCCLLSMFISIKNGNLLGGVYSYFNQIIERLSNLDTTIIFGSMPYWLVMIYYTIFILLIICLEKKDLSKIGLFASLILLVLIGLYNRQALTFYQQVTFLNVNQGDCCIIQDVRNGGVMLIDTGGLTYMDVAEKKIMPYLKYHGIRKIDVVVISHNDNDHCGALDELEQYIQIDKIIDDPYTESVSMGNIYLTNLNKYITKKSDENDKSLVLYGEICGMNFLFTGDASSSVESKIIKNNEELNVDVLKVGHHGSSTSSSKEFIEFISPTYGVISVGKNNTYGHPTSKVLETLEEYEVIIYRTDINGTTRFKGKILDKIYIETAK